MITDMDWNPNIELVKVNSSLLYALLHVENLVHRVVYTSRTKL